MKISLFIPCLTEHLYPESALSMVKVLKHLGHEVDYVENQTCCGQPAFNSGYRKEMIPIVERFIRLFQDKEVIVAPSGSCVAMVRIFYDELNLEKSLLPGLQKLKEKIYEFSEFLCDVLKVTSLGGRYPHKVTYHDSCHLNRELGVHEQPRQLIRNIGEIDFVEMENQPLYRIKCRIKQQQLSLQNGYSASLKKGMTFQARCMVSRRTLFQLLTDKAEDWLNPVKYQDKEISAMFSQ